jgi:P4 family phage/plasmid primase-like protien
METLHAAECKLERLRSIFGEDAVFLPIRKGEKRPFLNSWNELSIEDMSDPQHLRYLDSEENVGILLGSESPDSGHLVALDFDVDEAYAIFCKLNPELSKSATVRGERGAKVFLRTNELPGNGKIKDEDGNEVGDFLAKGKQAVVHGIHPSGCSYEWLSDKPPLFAELESIKLPNAWHSPWKKTLAQKLTELHGAALEQGANSHVRLNQGFFAGLTAALNTIVYSTREGTFYLYCENSGLWSAKSDEAAKKLADAAIFKYASKLEEDLKQVVLTKRTDAFLSAVLKLLKMQVETDCSFCSSKEGIIHFQNGVYEINADKLRLFDMNDYLISGIPFDYLPEARCPDFEQFLASALPADDLSLMQRLLGAFLMGINSAQLILLIYGGAGTGKSTLINIISKIIGLKNTASLRPKHLNSRFEIAQIRAAKLLIGADVPRDFLNNENAQMLKALTGGDVVSCELKGLNQPIELECRFNIAITGNARPVINIESDKDAWKRRLVLIHYEGSPPSRPIPDFADHLVKKEGSGIIQWCLQGALQYLKELNEDGRLSMSHDQKQRVEDLLFESESLARFVSNYIQREKGSCLSVEQIQDHYAKFCALKQWKPFQDKVFRRLLPDLMREHHYVSESHSIENDNSHCRGYRNLALVEFQQELLCEDPF